MLRKHGIHETRSVMSVIIDYHQVNLSCRISLEFVSIRCTHWIRSHIVPTNSFPTVTNFLRFFFYHSIPDRNDVILRWELRQKKKEGREREREGERIKPDNLLTNKMAALIDSAKFTSLHGPHCLLKHNGPKRRQVCAHFAEQAQVHSLNFVLTNYSRPTNSRDPPSCVPPSTIDSRLTIDSDRFPPSPRVQTRTPFSTLIRISPIRFDIFLTVKDDVASPDVEISIRDYYFSSMCNRCTTIMNFVVQPRESG